MNISVITKIVLCALSIPVGFLLYKIIRFVVETLRTSRSYPDIVRPYSLSKFPFFTLFAENGVRKLLEDVVSPAGDLKYPIANLGANVDGRPSILISDGETFGELLKVEKFPKLEMSYDTLSIILGEGLVTSKGELWKRQRKFLTPLFHFKALAAMPEIMTKRILEFNDELLATQGKPIHPIHPFGTMTLRIVIDCVFGGSEYLDPEVMAPLWDDVNKALNNYFLTALLLGKGVNDLIPFPWNVTLFKSRGKIVALIKRAIEKKKAALMNGEQSGDLLASLLKVYDEQTGETIPEQLIVDEALTFLFAGHDTTSALLSWAMTFLSRDPTVVQKIRDEVKQVVGDRAPTHADVKNLNYCNRVLRETLRMRPPVPILDRRTNSVYEIVGNKLEANTYVYPFLIAAHYDNRFWKDPWTFNPDRFDHSDVENQESRNPYSFVPFSANSRNCIGQKFALMEGALALAMIVPKFDVVSCTDEKDDNWSFEGTMKPLGFKCSFVPVK